MAFTVDEMRPRRLKQESKANSYKFGKFLLAVGWEAEVRRLLGQKRMASWVRMGRMQAVFWGRINRTAGVVE